MSQNGTEDSTAFKLAPSKPPKRRLVVMFDGTGNTRQSLTNVARMFEAIDDSEPKSYKCIGSDGTQCPPTPPFQGPASTRIIQCETCNQLTLEPANQKGDDSKVYIRAGVPCGSCHQLVVEPASQPVQKVKYIPGVRRDRHGVIAWLSAQTLHYNLSAKIKEGYTWLCENYRGEEDHVFVFGFSQGAFAARSLVSMLHKCDGVLQMTRKSKDHDKVIETACNYYDRECVESRDEKNEAEHRTDFITYLEAHNIRIEPLHVQVKMLGVWDAVGPGAFGVPIKSGIDNSRRLSRKHYQFHEKGLSCIVENAYHALALDEDLHVFEPTLWTSRDSTEQEVKQVWFAGSHCNVGGGADLHDNNDPDDLWQYSYVWMQRHAEKHGLRFYWSFEYPATRHANTHLRTRFVSVRKPQPSLKNFVWGLYSWLGTRSIRNTDPKLAMLHWSVVELIKVTHDDLDVQTKDLDGRKWEPYRPKSLFENHCSHKVGGLLFNMFNFLYFDRTGEGVGSPPAQALRLAEFIATVIPEGSTEVIAPDQVDAKGTPKWHIETDDVMTCTQWALEPREKEKEAKKGDRKQETELETGHRSFPVKEAKKVE